MTAVTYHWLYHITNISNLPQIVAAGGLWCDAELQARGLIHTSIAHAHIKERRSTTRVERRSPPLGIVAVGGYVSDYVPFYFAPRSPMLYTISRGNVVGYEGGQREVVYLVTAAELIAQHGSVFAFTDGHAAMAFSEFYDDLAYLNQVDWEVMNSRMWNDTLQYPDRKRKRQAEFLVHRFLPWEMITGIGVMSQQAADAVSAHLANVAHRPVVAIRQEWYY